MVGGWCFSQNRAGVNGILERLWMVLVDVFLHCFLSACVTHRDTRWRCAHRLRPAEETVDSMVTSTCHRFPNNSRPKRAILQDLRSHPLPHKAPYMCKPLSQLGTGIIRVTVWSPLLSLCRTRQTLFCHYAAWLIMQFTYKDHTYPWIVQYYLVSESCQGSF